MTEVIKKENLKNLKKVLCTTKKFRDNLDYHSKRACFSYDGYTKYGSFENWSIALDILNDIPDNESDCAELIVGDCKVKPYLDIEWKKGEFPTFDVKRVKNLITKAIQEIVNNNFSIDLEDHNILFANCHRAYDSDFKFSFHVIIYTNPQIIFRNKNDARFLANALIDYFDPINCERKCSSLPINEMCYNCKNISNKIFDTSVYNKGLQNFRLIGHSKQNNWGYPIKTDPDYPDVDPINYLVTNIGNDYSKSGLDCTVLEVPEQHDYTHRDLKNVVNIGEDDPRVDEVIDVVRKLHPSAEFEKVDFGGFLQFNYSDRYEPCFTDKDQNIFHEKIGFFAYIFENKVFAGCHSGRCVGNDGKKKIESIGSLLEKTVLSFEKVSFDNRFDDIPDINIIKYIHDGAIGISNMFKEMYLEPKRIKWIDESKQGESYFWNGKLWENDKFLFLDRLLVETVVRRLRSFNKTIKSNEDTNTEDAQIHIEVSQKLIDSLLNGRPISTILRFIKPLIRDTEFPNTKDIHPYWISCKNGMVDLYSGELRLAVPDDNITKCIETEYDINADSSEFDAFVKQITSDEKGECPEIYDYLRWFIGYAMQGNPNKKLFMILYGKQGYNGKSMLLNMISEVLKYYATNMDKSVVLEAPKKTGGSHSTELMQLENCRFGILSDTTEGSTLDDGNVKQLTGVTDKISAREIFGKQKEFIPKFVPFISSNHEIMLNLSDKAMFDRTVILPFVLSFVQEPILSYQRLMDPDLESKFRKNKQGTLKWLIDAAIYYNSNPNKVLPDILKEAKISYNKKVNKYLEFFEKNFVKEEGSSIKRSELFEIFKVYSKENGIRVVKNEYTKAFDTLFEIDKVRRSVCYMNIRYTNDDNDESDDLDE